MSANIEAKKQIVEEIKAKIVASKSVVLADYNKLTVLEVTALRNQFRSANCEYKVYKNTLVRKAFNELGVTVFLFEVGEKVFHAVLVSKRFTYLIEPFCAFVGTYRESGGEVVISALFRLLSGFFKS